VGNPVACVAARTTAVAVTSAANAPSEPRSGSPGFVPVATADTVSPIYDRPGRFMIAIL
jgi:hypothetical protein